MAAEEERPVPALGMGIDRGGRPAACRARWGWGAAAACKAGEGEEQAGNESAGLCFWSRGFKVLEHFHPLKGSYVNEAWFGSAHLIIKKRSWLESTRHNFYVPSISDIKLNNYKMLLVTISR
jgi:hypothetical protein